MKNIFLLLPVLFSVVYGYAQNVGIGTANPNASAMLDVTSTTKGVLVPRMTQAQRNAITNPATGLLIFQSDGTKGFYYNNGTPSVPGWMILGILPSNPGGAFTISGNPALYYFFS